MSDDSHGISKEDISSFPLFHSSSSHDPTRLASFWDDDTDEDDEDDGGGSEILVFEDTQHRAELEGRDAEMGSEAETETMRDDEEESLKAKRNSLNVADEDASLETLGLSSIPKAAALQSGAQQSLSLGSLNAYNRGQVFHGFNFPRKPSCATCSMERNLCQIISGIFTRSQLLYGYSLVTPIPAGVCNITVVEMKPSKNFFAIRKKDGSYALNGNWKIQAGGNYGIAGTLFSYSPSDGTRGEKLESPGPLIEPIDLMIIYQSPNPGIKYEYRVPIFDITGQQHPSRIMPVMTSHGSPSSPFNIDPPLSKPNSFSPAIPSLPSQGGSTVLTGRTSFFSSGRNTGVNTIIPKRPTSARKNSKPTGSVNNWNPSFIPGLNKIPVSPGTAPITGSQNSNFGQGVSPLYPPQVTASGSKSFHRGGETRATDSLFKNERFPGVLNTDPRTIPNRSSFPEEKKFDSHPHVSFQPKDNNHSLAVKRTEVPFHAIPEQGDKQPHIDNRLHRARHKHGSREIIPGPAVGGKGVSPITPLRDNNFGGPVLPHIPLKKNNGGKERTDLAARRDRRRRRRGRRKNGRKKGRKGRKKRYRWVFKGLTECTRSCGGGNQTSVYSCEHRRKARVVADRFCEGAPRAKQKMIPCNLKPCPARWVPGDWSDCSVTCGVGLQTRQLLCKQAVSPSLTMMVPEGACLLPKEGNTTQVCQLEECPSSEPKWKVGNWSSCSTTCGLGKRTRSIDCILMGNVVDNDTCASIDFKPSVEESCDMGSCATNTWFFSRWSDKCSETCGEGIQNRVVMCMTTNRNLDSSCNATKRPSETRSCTETFGCGGKWFAGPWTECSVSCGLGVETRIVKCLEYRKTRWSIVTDVNCIIDLKPSTSRECVLQECRPEWYMSEWGQCSVPCGTGFQRREVKCLDISQTTSLGCFNTSKPEAMRPCNEFSCPTVSTAGNSGNDTRSITTKITNEDGVDVPKSSGNQPTLDQKVKDNDDSHGKDQSVETLNQPTKKHEDFDITKSTDDNTQTNELEVVHETGNALNVIPDKDAQGDESVADDVEEHESESLSEEERKKKNKGDANLQNSQENESKAVSPAEEKNKFSCIDRIKNCHLVFRARLCRLKYYNKLCCLTCHGSKR